MADPKAIDARQRRDRVGVLTPSAVSIWQNRVLRLLAAANFSVTAPGR